MARYEYKTKNVASFGDGIARMNSKTQGLKSLRYLALPPCYRGQGYSGGHEGIIRGPGGLGTVQPGK